MRRPVATTVTVETDVAPDVTAELYALYQTSFAHLEQLAAARHLLHEDEFQQEVADPRVVKYVAWDTDGAPIGLCTVTSSLDAVPWISPGFYAHQYPDHHARGAIHYVGVMMVHPSARGTGAFREIVRHIVASAAEVGAVLAWDLCGENESAGLHRLFSSMLQSMASATVSEIDRQIYFGAVVEAGSLAPGAGPQPSAMPAQRAGS